MSTVVLSQSVAQHTLGAESSTGCAEGSHVIQLIGPPMLSLYTPHIIARDQGVFFSQWDQLVEPVSDAVVSRTAETSLEIAGSGGGLVTPSLWRLLRPSDDDHQMHFELDGLSVEVLQSDESGPTALHFDIPALGRPDMVCVVDYRDGVLVPASLPEIGEDLVLRVNPAMP